MQLLPVPVRPLAIGLVAGALFLGACGGDDGANDAATTTTTTTTGEGDDATVEIQRSRFAPLEITVGAGATVEFVNLDPYAHTVSAADDSPLAYDSGTFGEGEVFRQRFAEAGTYDYFCQIHPTMRASVIVE